MFHFLQYNDVLGITNYFLYPNNSKKYEKNLYLTKPRYSEQILPVSWSFIISRFHCNLVAIPTSTFLIFLVFVTQLLILITR